MLAVLHVLGLLIAFFASSYLIPVAGSLLARDGLALDFVIAAAINLGVGLGLAYAFRRHRRELKARDGFLLVSLAWVLLSGAATVPLLIALPGLSFTDAYFEALSGLTTTGATVMQGLDSMPASINLWRHTLHWIGGLGIIVLAIAILPLLGVGGMQLYKAEAPGPVKDEKLTPRIAETAKSLWLAYLILTALCIAALKLCGVSWLDAICHAMSAVALGGFSTHDASIAWFDSLAVELVLIAVMVIASLSFLRHFVALRRATLKPYLTDPEGRTILMLLTTSVLAIALLLWDRGTYATFPEALRHAAFNTISVATTTGFGSDNYGQWPHFAGIWMLFLCCILCSTGSTGGGIKMFRTLMLARQAMRELRLLVHPSAVISVRIGGQVVPDRVAQSILGFIFLYIATIAAVTVMLLLTDLDFLTAVSAAIASVNNTGPGLGEVGPSYTYAALSNVQKWICGAAMLLGRLEILSVLVLFTPTFWRK